MNKRIPNIFDSITRKRFFGTATYEELVSYVKTKRDNEERDRLNLIKEYGTSGYNSVIRGLGEIIEWIELSFEPKKYSETVEEEARRLFDNQGLLLGNITDA